MFTGSLRHGRRGNHGTPDTLDKQRKEIVGVTLTVRGRMLPDKT